MLRQAVAVCPSHPDVYSNLGNVHRDNGELVEAEACYRKAIELAPGHVNARYNLAILLDQLERAEEAVTAYRTVVDLQPDHSEAHYYLGMLLYRSGQLDRAVLSGMAGTRPRQPARRAHAVRLDGAYPAGARF